jgi:hypothetical protein
VTAVDVDALDKLREAATPGPWMQHPADSAYVIGEVVEDEEGPADYLDVADAGGRPPGYPGSAVADAALIVAAVNALPHLTAAIRGVLAVHGAIDAVQYLGARQIPRRVCTGCGSDDGNWQIWPCPTVRAITAALSTDEGTDR